MNVFTYGSLMFAPVWTRVVRGRYVAMPARVHGFERWSIRDESYPGCLEREGGTVEGVLYLDVAPADIARLDEFEGEHYSRVPCLVTLTDSGTTVPAWIYRYEQTSRIVKLPWSPEAFQATQMQTFIETYTPTKA